MLTEYQKNHPNKAALKSAFSVGNIIFYLLIILGGILSRLNVKNIELKEKNIKLELQKYELINKYLDLNHKYKDSLNGK